MNNIKITSNIVLDKIKAIIKDKEDRKIHPTHALFIPLKNEFKGCDIKVLKGCINELARKDKIKYGSTINDMYICLN